VIFGNQKEKILPGFIDAPRRRAASDFNDAQWLEDAVYP
jgi:hypothetical protein